MVSTTLFQFSLIICSLICTIASASSPRLDRQIEDAAHHAALDPKLVRAVISVESNFDANALSNKGAMGLMQLMPQTADAVGVNAPFHTLSNLMGACRYLRRLINRYQGNLKLALAAYNAGPANVDRYKGIPPFQETRNYVTKVLSRYEKFQKTANN